MPDQRTHLRASKVILRRQGNPLVHRLMDEGVKVLGARHRYLSHNIEFIEGMGELLGEEAREEAYLHFLLDLGVLDVTDIRKSKGGQP